MKEFSTIANVTSGREERRTCSTAAGCGERRERLNVYFLGIGGIGMSALARYFLHEGQRVAGYDRVRSHLTDQIEAEGAVVHYEEDPALIPADFRDPATTIVVYTPAVPADHTELRWFEEHGFEIVKRSQMLGYLSQGKFVMAVAGTHGKTTTTTLVAWLNHRVTGGGSAFLGGISRNFSSNLVLGRGRRLAVEADEFDRSFHWLNPYIAVVTATDPDHLDIYGTEEAYLESFAHFTELIQPGGTLICHTGLKLRPRPQQGVAVYHYSRNEGDFHAENVRKGNGEIVFDFVSPKGTIKDVKLGVPVDINIENAVAAMAVCQLVGVPDDVMRNAVGTFLGPKRRFEFWLKEPGKNGKVIIDDYAHHPDELKASIRSVKDLYPNRRLTVVFQPHLYTRTRDFAPQFAEALSLADDVLLLDIYPARELPIPGVTSEIILKDIKCKNKALCNKNSLVETIKNYNFDVLLTAGAGDICNYLPQICEVVKQKH